MTTATERPDPAASAAAEHRPGLLARLNDRLNPILVREVHQALNGKGFLATISLALVAIVIIALWVASEGQDIAGDGGEVFYGTLVALVPLLICVVPLIAFNSMREEVTRGTVDHLHLSRLGPGAIVRGKLAAAMVQFLLILAIFAPLLGLTFLLRGVDVPTIATSIAVVFLIGLGACSMAVAGGALFRWPKSVRALPALGVFLGLISLTIGLLGEQALLMGFGYRPEFALRLLGFGGPAIGGTLLFGMIGASALAHPYENRSTGFRVLALGALLVGLVWVLGMMVYSDRSYAHPSSTRSVWADAEEWIPLYVVAAAACLCLFPIFAATEDREMSPRVRSRVSAGRIRAALSAPFLPGGGRGLLYAHLVAAVALVVASLPAFFWAGRFDRNFTGQAVIAWLYVLAYCGLAGFVRGFLPRGPRGNWIARAVVPLTLLLGALVPLLVHAFREGPRVARFRGLDFLNPFVILDRYDGHSGRSPERVIPYLIAGCGALLALNIRKILLGLVEVGRASAERRRRASGDA